MRAQADVLAPSRRSATTRIDAVEDDLLAHVQRSAARLAGRAATVLVRLQRLLAPEPAALFRLVAEATWLMAEADAQGLRDASEEFSVVLRDRWPAGAHRCCRKR